MAKFMARPYRVTKCGYYLWRDTTPRIGDLESVLEDLKNWSAGKQLVQTKIEGSASKLPTYLFDLRKAGDCWVLVLWNEVPSDQGSVSSVMPTDTVGSANVLPNRLHANSIPGFATYFLFIPSAGLVVPLRAGDVVTGLEQFKEYFRIFLHRSSSWVVLDDQSDDVPPPIVGYLDRDDEVNSSVWPRFDIQLLRLGTQSDMIISKAADIRKVIRVQEIDPMIARDRAKFQRMLDAIGMTAAPRGKTVRVQQELAVTMTEEQVVELIESVTPDIEPLKNDVAFEFVGDTRSHWLSYSIPRLEFELAIEKRDGVYDVAQLATLLDRKRDEILRQV